MIDCLVVLSCARDVQIETTRWTGKRIDHFHRADLCSDTFEWLFSSDSFCVRFTLSAPTSMIPTKQKQCPLRRPSAFDRRDHKCWKCPIKEACHFYTSFFLCFFNQRDQISPRLMLSMACNPQIILGSLTSQSLPDILPFRPSVILLLVWHGQ